MKIRDNMVRLIAVQATVEVQSTYTSEKVSQTETNKIEGS